MPDNPVTLTLPAAKDGLVPLIATFTNAQIIGATQSPPFGTATTGEFFLPVGSWLLCDFSSGAIPTGPTTNLRNTPAPAHQFTNGVTLPFDAADRVVKVPNGVLGLGPTLSSDLSGHRIELGFGAAPAGGNAANRLRVVVLGMQIQL